MDPSHDSDVAAMVDSCAQMSLSQVSKPNDGDFVILTDKFTGQVEVGTFDSSGNVNPVVVLYARNHLAVKVTDSFTVETIQKDNKDPLVNRLLEEHCAAAPDGDL